MAPSPENTLTISLKSHKTPPEASSMSEGNALESDSSAHSDPTLIGSPLSSSKKRKREEIHLNEIEVNVAAPEPPSKKALRKAKKGKIVPIAEGTKPTGEKLGSDIEKDETNKVAAQKRSDYGIWIGNLPWTATKADLRKFLTTTTNITEEMITRIHMPSPSQATLKEWRQKIKPFNKGFAYADFSSNVALAEAMDLSETLFTGRRVLIKDSKSFEGRPEAPKEKQDLTESSTKPLSKRIFVGNLAFDTTKEELQEHFSQCGELLDVFMATFEDTGKCKGYAWVEFAELEGGVAAMRGWVNMTTEKERGDTEDETDSSADNAATKKPPKVRKWWVNRIRGRPLRMEYAEDKAVRYKKRFGKDGTARRDAADGENPTAVINDAIEAVASLDPRPMPKFERKTKGAIIWGTTTTADPRTVKAGADLAGTARMTGVIVESKGKKITFD